MTNEAVAAMPLASGAANQDRIGSKALARGLLLMRASAIHVVRLQLAMERRDRKAALRTVDELMRLTGASTVSQGPGPGRGCARPRRSTHRACPGA